MFLRESYTLAGVSKQRLCAVDVHWPSCSFPLASFPGSLQTCRHLLASLCLQGCLRAELQPARSSEASALWRGHEPARASAATRATAGDEDAGRSNASCSRRGWPCSRESPLRLLRGRMPGAPVDEPVATSARYYFLNLEGHYTL